MEYSEEYILSTVYNRWGIQLKRVSDEWHGPCPILCKCGEDRFVVFADGGYWCRQCNSKGWIDEDRKDWKPDPLYLENQSKRLKDRQAEQLRVDTAWKEGHQVGYYEGWNAAMGEKNYKWWADRGVDKDQIIYYKLGYRPNKKVMTIDERIIEVGAYTIPAYDPVDWRVRNIHYRLDDAPGSVQGKYRLEHSLTPASFYSESTVKGDALVVEGAIKALVLHRFLDESIQVVGLPGMNPKKELIDELKGFNRVWLALDPGSEKQAKRIQSYLGKCYIASLAFKPDDMVLAGMTREEFRGVMKNATK